ncbi:hypothetical protein DK37_15940 [Halomonas sp. SUBG004]|nr:hypothetical protein DK37_15940 [Halomonas sp. SUBG004]
MVFASAFGCLPCFARSLIGSRRNGARFAAGFIAKRDESPNPSVARYLFFGLRSPLVAASDVVTPPWPAYSIMPRLITTLFA